MAATRKALRSGPRLAYDIVFRCTLNGCDWTARLFLRNPNEAFDAMHRRCAWYKDSHGNQKRHGRNCYRVVSCTVSADQSRPVMK